MNAGEIKNFDAYLPSLLNYADFLVQSDEISKALELLTTGMPGYYRDKPPQQVLDLKAKIYKFLMNNADYAKAPDDFNQVNPKYAKDLINGLLRGRLILNQVKKYNAEGITPHIVEIGPGEFWMPIGLKEEQCKFTYQTFFIHKDAYEKAKQYFQDELTDTAQGPVIYVACEIIEHLHFPQELPQTLAKTGHVADWIHLSTPLYTFGGGLPNWSEKSKQGLGGHLKTYTPREFEATVSELFPQYSFEISISEIMSAVGKLDRK